VDYVAGENGADSTIKQGYCLTSAID